MTDGAADLPLASHVSQSSLPCDACAAGKSHRQPLPKTATHRATRCLELVHSDMWGPINVDAHGGWTGFLTFIDDFSREAVVYLMNSKSGADVLTHLTDYKAWAENITGQRLAALRTDNGGEFINSAAEQFLRQHGVTRQVTTVYTSSQNGVAERFNRTIMDTVRSMLHHANLADSFWPLAVQAATYVKNRCPTSAVQHMVTMVLQDGALEWMQRKNQDIADSAARLGIDVGPLLVWDGEIRRAFIQQHLGTDTAELWLSKLDMLVLGSEKTPTPIELDSQFDAIARHVYPTMPADDDENEMLLWTKYKSIISRSKPRLYENIVRGGNRPNTLKGWKAALSSQWLGEEEIKAERQKNAAVSHSNSSGGHGGRGGGRGRGGQYGPNRGGGETRTQTATVNAMSNDDSGAAAAAGMEGESYTNEGENDEPQGQLSAARGGVTGL